MFFSRSSSSSSAHLTTKRDSPPLQPPQVEYPYSKNWAKSLTGLRLLVKEKWWDEGSGSGENTYPAKVTGLQPKDVSNTVFRFQCDNDENQYDMDYKDILVYADGEQEEFNKYELKEWNPTWVQKLREEVDLKKKEVSLKFNSHIFAFQIFP